MEEHPRRAGSLTCSLQLLVSPADIFCCKVRVLDKLVDMVILLL